MQQVTVVLTLDNMLEIGRVETLDSLRVGLGDNEVNVADSSIDPRQANEEEILEGLESGKRS